VTEVKVIQPPQITPPKEGWWLPAYNYYLNSS